jgi:hypothetical protein
MTDASNRSWTSQKLDWLRCVSFDRTVKSFDFEVAFCIIQHANASGRTWPLSDETIAEEIGSGSVRNVYNARIRLRANGWFRWRRTGIGNIYEIRFEKVNSVLDALIVMREARKQRQKKRRIRDRDTQWASYLKPSDTQPPSGRDTQQVAENHLRDSPKEEGLPKKNSRGRDTLSGWMDTAAASAAARAATPRKLSIIPESS